MYGACINDSTFRLPPQPQNLTCAACCLQGTLATEHGTLPPTSFAEPTITISTRDAFAAINNMFGGRLQVQQPDAAGAACPGAGAFPAPAPRPPCSQPVAGSGQQEVCEDTVFVREDTQFVFGSSDSHPPSPTAPGRDFSIREDTQCIAPRHPPAAAAAAGDFSIREDTQFIASRPPTAAADGGFRIREDTQFIAAPRGSPPPVGTGGFDIREDTQFVAVAVSPCSRSVRPPATVPLGGRTNSAGSVGADGLPLPGGSAGSVAGGGQVSKWGFAPGVEDTLALDLGDTQALLVDGLGSDDGDSGPAGHGEGAPSSGLALHMQSLKLSEGKENILPEAASAAAHRDIHDAAVAACALQPVHADARALGGIAMLEDEAAELALVGGEGAEDGGLPQDDSFGVLPDNDSLPLMGSPAGSSSEVAAGEGAPGQQGEQGSMPGASLAAATVDPFRPGFQASMVDSLDPPLTQASLCSCELLLHCLAARHQAVLCH